MYVTKTCANLSTYGRKPGKYNSTINFEINVMKKYPAINSKFTFLPLSKPKWHFFSGAVADALSSVAECKQKQTKQPKH